MSKKCLLSILVITAVILVVSSGQAGADTGKAGDDLTYGYYGIRGGANFMTVSDFATAPSPCTMPVPTAKQAFTYTPVVDPVLDCRPAKAKPIGVGEVAGGGSGVDLHVKVGPFEAPVDVSFGLFAAAFDATDIYFINVYNQLTSVQEEVLSELEAETAFPSKSSNGQGNGQDKNNNGNGNAGNGQGNGNGQNNGQGNNQGNGQNNGQGNSQIGNGSGSGNGQGAVTEEPKPRKKFRKLTAWKSNVTSVEEQILKADTLPPGLYVIILNVTRVSPSEDNFDRFYRWITYFIVPDAQ